MKYNKEGKISITVSNDGMKAFADVIPPLSGGKAVAVEEANRALADAGVVYGIIDDARMSAAIKTGAKKKCTFVIAMGKHPSRGEDASLKLLWKERSNKPASPESEKVDHRELGIVESVKPGETIAEILQPTFGAHGMTVTGLIVPGKPGRSRFFKAGANTKAAGGNNAFISEIHGVPSINDNVISVSPTFEVAGNVDYSVGNIEFAGTVVVKGDVRDGFTIKALGDVFIGGHVEAAKIISGGSVQVCGGIITRFSGYVVAEGSVYAKHITNSIVEAEGDVVSNREILNSFVRANGSVKCINGDGRISGGDIMARDEIHAVQIGSSKETSTVLRAGYNFKTYMIVSELEQRLVMIDSMLRDTDRYILSSGPGKSEAAVRMEESVPALKREKVRLAKEIKALEAAAPVNTDAVIKCENEARAGVVVFIGENSKRISWPMRNVLLRLDDNYRVRVEMLSIKGKPGEEPGNRVGASVGESLSGDLQDNPRASVMVMDVSEDSRERLKEILDRSNFDIAGETGNAEESVRLYKKYIPDIVIADISATNQEGINAVKEIFEADPDAVFVMTIGGCDMDVLREAISLGAAHFLLKPYHRKNVLDALYRALSLRDSDRVENTG